MPCTYKQFLIILLQSLSHAQQVYRTSLARLSASVLKNKALLAYTGMIGDGRIPIKVVLPDMYKRIKHITPTVLATAWILISLWVDDLKSESKNEFLQNLQNLEQTRDTLQTRIVTRFEKAVSKQRKFIRAQNPNATTASLQLPVLFTDIVSAHAGLDYHYSQTVKIAESHIVGILWGGAQKSHIRAITSLPEFHAALDTIQAIPKAHQNPEGRPILRVHEKDTPCQPADPQLAVTSHEWAYFESKYRFSDSLKNIFDDYKSTAQVKARSLDDDDELARAKGGLAGAGRKKKKKVTTPLVSEEEEEEAEEEEADIEGKEAEHPSQDVGGSQVPPAGRVPLVDRVVPTGQSFHAIPISSGHVDPTPAQGVAPTIAESRLEESAVQVTRMLQQATTGSNRFQAARQVQKWTEDWEEVPRSKVPKYLGE